MRREQYWMSTMRRELYGTATIYGPQYVRGMVTDCGNIGIVEIRQYGSKKLYSVDHIPTGYRICAVLGYRAARACAAECAAVPGIESGDPETIKAPLKEINDRWNWRPKSEAHTT